MYLYKIIFFTVLYVSASINYLFRQMRESVFRILIHTYRLVEGLSIPNGRTKNGCVTSFVQLQYSLHV